MEDVSGEKKMSVLRLKGLVDVVEEGRMVINGVHEMYDMQNVFGGPLASDEGKVILIGKHLNGPAVMNVLVIGSGGREHALCWSLAKSEKVQTVFVAPGNGGTVGPKVTPVPSLKTFEDMSKFAVQNNVELVIPGPEQPLVDGIAGVFKKVGISVFGPSASAARIEGSKSFSKDFMKRHNIPTADYATFTDHAAACSHVMERYKGGDVVIKASGLAAGKGVYLPGTIEEALANLKTIMLDHEFGNAGDDVVIEERLEGEEVSVLAFTDGYTIVPCPGAQDHKRIFEGDKAELLLTIAAGPNTGGMGAYAPAPVYTHDLEVLVKRIVLQRTVDGMRRDGSPFVGCLYAGLMLTPSGPKVLEFNCRFGDPETQVVLPLLKSDLFDVMLAAAEGRLDSVAIEFHNSIAATVVLASEGYPGSYPKNREITVGSVNDALVFHAGTSVVDGKLLTSGGRVLAVTGVADSLEGALKRAAIKLLKDKVTVGMTYASAGVSIDAGNLLVEKIKSCVKATRRPGADADIGGFGGVFDLLAAGYGDSETILVSGTDGVGTKLKLAQACNLHGTIGIDLVAMSVNDVLVQGAEPLFFLDYFACSKLEVDVAKDVVAGIAAGCLQSECALIGGETAEMPGMYEGGDYDLAGFVVGAVKRPKLLPRLEDIRPGDVVLGIPSSGLHSNGFSLVRKVVAASGLDYSSPCPWAKGATLGEALLTPTKIYVKELLPLLKGGDDVKALCHITGGGFTDNIPRCLPRNVGVEIDLNAWTLPDVFKWLQAVGNILESEMSRTFNCGIGMVLVVSADKADVVSKRIVELGGGPVVKMGKITPLTANPVVYKK
ncbi:hypothetical protein HK101_002054 [Irineochytrium annulatum]|nr:hypothetical protein HK101_002054 [Irineochytrium annulatum]